MPREQWAFLLDPLIEAMRELRLQRPPARRARECRLPGQGRADPLRPRALSRPAAARSRSSSRNSSWTNGPASPTRPSSTRCARFIAFTADDRASAARDEQRAATRPRRRRSRRVRPERRASPAGRRRAAGSISTAGCPSSSSTAATSRATASPGGSRSTARPIWSGRPSDDRGRARGARARSSPRMRRRMAGRLLLIALDDQPLDAARRAMRRSCRRSSPGSAPATTATSAAPPTRSTQALRRDRDRPAPLQGRARRSRRSAAERSTAIARSSSGCRSACRKSIARRTAAIYPQLAPRPGGRARRCAAARGLRLHRRRQARRARPLSRARPQRLSRRRAQGRPQARRDVARSFDFLLSVSPINTAEAIDQFLADEGEQAAAASATGR